MTSLVSVVINNHNYARFLGEAIESALGQSHEPVEVVVVDDGSTDDSRAVIASYGDRVRALFKANGGQTSALNAGLAASRGEMICFLDADDCLYPETIEAAARRMDGTVAKVHWHLDVVDEEGNGTGETRPKQPPTSGNLRDLVVAEGPEAYPVTPTSGNLWSRTFLNHVMPLDDGALPGAGSAHADALLSMLAPLFGGIEALPKPGGRYRVHGGNDYAGMGAEAKLQRDLRCFDHRCQVLERYCQARGFAADVNQWKADSWLYKAPAARKEIAGVVPPGANYLLVDGQQLATILPPGRAAVPFLERNGEYWGAPEDDSTAISELERMRGLGAGWLVIAWPCFWWLEHYTAFASYLRERFRCVLDNQTILAFELS